MNWYLTKHNNGFLDYSLFQVRKVTVCCSPLWSELLLQPLDNVKLVVRSQFDSIQGTIEEDVTIFDGFEEVLAPFLNVGRVGKGVEPSNIISQPLFDKPRDASL